MTAPTPVPPVAIDLVLNPVDATWAQIRDVALAAADKGYQGIWVLDHVSGEPFGATTTSECFTLLGALAVSAPGLPIGPLVANAAARPVAVTALAFETLGRIVGDRLRIAIGAGAGDSGPFATEHRVLGTEPGSMRERHERVVRLVAAIGERAGIEETPITIGANSRELARIAGRVASGVNVGVDHPRRGEFIAAARSQPDRAVEVSAWARSRPDLLDPVSAVRRSLDDDRVARLMIAVRPVETSVHELASVVG